MLKQMINRKIKLIQYGLIKKYDYFKNTRLLAAVLNQMNEIIY